MLAFCATGMEIQQAAPPLLSLAMCFACLSAQFIFHDLMMHFVLVHHLWQRGEKGKW